MVNTYTGGPYQQAVSTTTMLNNSWYDGELYQKYAYEYTPGSDEDSGIAWYVGEDISMRFDARALAPNGNIGQRLISEEPMSIVMNLGISENWVDINWAALKFPTIMRIDYVRIYQPEGEEMITCDPPGYETTEYIKNHPEAYNNYNYTVSTFGKILEMQELMGFIALDRYSWIHLAPEHAYAQLRCFLLGLYIPSTTLHHRSPISIFCHHRQRRRRRRQAAIHIPLSTTLFHTTPHLLA